MELWIVPLGLPPAGAARCLEVLDPAERARASRLREGPGRTAWVAAHAALRALLGAALGCPPAAVRWRAGPQGKPLLDPMHGTGLHFNLSHAESLALIALHRGAPVGVDIESLARAPARAPDLRALLSPPERAAIARLPLPAQPLATYRCWVRKEALLKAAGCGIDLAGLAALSVSCDAPARLLASAHPGLRATGWSLRALESPGRWTAAVAAAGPMPRAIAVRWWHGPQAARHPTPAGRGPAPHNLRNP